MDLRERIEKRQVRVDVIESNEAPSSDDWLPRTRSQTIQFLTNPEGEFIGEAHCYRQPTRLLAASGQPDPKVVALNGDDWYIWHAEDDYDPDCPGPCPTWRERASEARREEIEKRGRWVAMWDARPP